MHCSWTSSGTASARGGGELNSGTGLLQALVPLVDHIEWTLSGRHSNTAKHGQGSHGCQLIPRLSEWTKALQKAATTAPSAADGGGLPSLNAISPALRLCPLCGENLAAPNRMQAHVAGKRHCTAVAAAFLRSVSGGEEWGEGTDLRYGVPPTPLPTEETASEVLQSLQHESSGTLCA